MFPSNPGNRRQYFYLPEGETSEVQSSADASCISREDLDSKGCQLHWADHCKYRNDRSGGGRNQFGFETIIYRRKSVFPDYCGSSMGTVSLRDMLADSFVDVLLSKDGDGPDLFTWDGSEFDSFDCLDNRIQMVDESVCNFAKADVSGSSNTAKRTSGSAGKCHVYAAGTGKECDRSGNLTQYGIICPVDSYDSKMVSEEDGSRMGKIKKLVGSEFLKLKGTWIFWIHLGVPVAGAGLFLLYGVAAKREWQSVLEFYAETLAIVYPSVSAIICMQSVMQEIKGGKFSKSAVCVNIALERSVEKDTHTLDSRIGGITACFFTLWNGRLGNESCVESVGKRISYMRADLVDNAGRNLSSALFSGNAFRKWSLSGSRGDAESDCGIALYWIRRWTLDVVSMWMEWTSAVVLCKMENRERSV